ncbi:MAG: ATP-binding protein [Candidatus Binatus sp.]|uniref:sensor histidine kinase n=1 Tax=Candidatus Binatus sp. TaxID=2811406 RepID=UPI0027228649|nr:ATP-binding protein [Candidatus Binatus sp.]MDO8433184.1 ATP-binding protein [Candidatus Binatus sp.]
MNNSEKSISPHRLAERKRRRRELIAVGVAAATLLAFVLAQTELPPLTRHTSLGSNLAVITLFNLSFLLLGLMLFLVGRNLAKVIFERRRGLIGSKLQVRLVAGFIAVALIPSAFLLYVSGVFLHADINSWFNPAYEHILDDSLEIAKTYYLNSANNASHYARVLAGEIATRGLLASNRRNELKLFIDKRQQEYNLGTIEVFSSDRKLLLIDISPKIPTGIGASPDSPIISQTLKGQALTRTDRLGGADVIRGSAPIYVSPESDNVIGAVLVDYYLPKSLSTRASDISNVSEDYFQLRILRQPILNSYIMTLVLIGLVVVTLASWFGMFLARGITGPIKLLARGTQAIARGDLNYKIPAVGDDEIGHLVDSFNQMTSDLRASAEELERRRQYTETLLANVSAGVVGLDSDGVVTTINPCAERLLGLDGASVIGNHYLNCFPPRLGSALDDLFSSAMRPREARLTVKLEVAGAEAELMMTASPLGDSADGSAGTVLFFEDVSQIAKVERMEAWREVARRIAHEIKNPLTPIQLSAERMRRQLASRPGIEAALVEECTKTIIGEVEDLKKLVNEFSSFARMPHLNPVPNDINALASEAVGNFREANPAVEFNLELDASIPLIPIDREAMKRAVVNLLDNAVGATTAYNKLNGERPSIEVRSRWYRAKSMVTLEVADNGPGIDPRLRTRIFEPYYSSKRGGTGLGLAIVSAVVTDHHGFVRVVDNQPRGSRFVIEFPVRDQAFAKAIG